MKRVQVVLAVFPFFLWPSYVFGQSQAPATKASPSVPNLAQFEIQSVSASTKGIAVVLQGQNCQKITGTIETQDPTTGEYHPFVDSVGIGSIPNEVRDPSAQGVGTVTFPILVNADTQYRLTIWARSGSDPNMDFGQEKSRLFSYKPATAPSSKPFKLEIGPSSLKVSAATDDVAKLTAEWHVGGGNIGTLSDQHQNPQVALLYGALGSTGNELPTVSLKLENPTTHDTQTAVVTLAVATDSSLKSKTAKASADSQKNQTKPTFSWQDLAKTGVGALLKYFGAAVL